MESSVVSGGYKRMQLHHQPAAAAQLRSHSRELAELASARFIYTGMCVFMIRAEASNLLKKEETTLK